MRTNQHFDLAIIGDGITGLSAALHLLRLGAPRICLIRSGGQVSASSKAAGLISGGCLDNVTRISHRHGLDAAASLWDWTQTAFERLVSFAEEQELPFTQAKRVRWITTEDEMAEAELAVKQFKQIGLPAELMSQPAALRQGYGPQGPCRGVQLDGTGAAFIDAQKLLGVLREKTKNIESLNRARRLESKGGTISIETDDGTIEAEAVIIANHLSMAELLPPLREALVAYADQWHEWEIDSTNTSLPVAPGTLFSWRHGHYWGGITGSNRVRLGGARFLRPLAGFEASSAPLESKIEEHLLSAWNEIFPQNRLKNLVRSEAGLDCWPNDELPLVGPMFGEPRILLATGFMGQGMAMGFYAGCCLAELVQGLRPPLPRLLWPERHRHLPEGNG